MLIEIVIIEAGDGRFEDMGGGRRAGGNPPAPILKEQRGLGLRSCETELTGERRAEPGGCVLAQLTQALCYIIVTEPRDLTRSSKDPIDLPRWREADRAGAIFPYWRRQQGEGRGCRDVKRASPSSQDGVVVGQ
ncbi:MAG: hypothetical protein M3071_11810 [Actinomycetota bacterium]|nr:hypothetical protein [Actinomycetota bacterium]